MDNTSMARCRSREAGAGVLKHHERQADMIGGQDNRMPHMRALSNPRHDVRPRSAAAVALSLLLLIPAAVQAQVYKWTDAAGSVHYSQTPPPSQHYTEMAVTPPSSTSDQDAGQVGELIQHQQDAADREAEDKHKAAEQAKRLAERAAQCVKARDDLSRLTTGSDQRHMVKDEDGTIRRLSDDEHEALVGRIRQIIADNCGE